VFTFNSIRLPVVIVAFAKRQARTYVSPRFEPSGGPTVSSRLTAMDVENQEFKRKIRGFDPEEVGYFLKSVAEEIERLNLENGELWEEMGRLRSEHGDLRAREELLQKTLVTAQKMSQEMQDRARKEAELILRDARMKSERTLHDAQENLAKLEAEISRCKIERDLFEKRLRSTVEEHLTLLEQRREETGSPDNVRVLPRRTGSEAG